MRFIIAAENPDMTAIGEALSFVWFRVMSFVDFANEHPPIWIPVAFSVAGATVWLFKSAMGANHNNIS